MKFKSNIEVQAGLEDASGSPGTVNQLLSSTATGTAWIDPSTIVAEAASLVIIACKNTSGAAIPKGTPVYQTGNVGATATIEIAPADALISANKLPAIGVLQTDLNNNGFGNVVITGELTNFTTSPIDGVVPTTGDKIFVKSGGGLTLTKPTGEGNGIQNMGLVGKVSSGNSGSITVSSIMRTNDVPNLPEGRIWIGDGNTIVSDTVYVDEPNNRVGIGTTAPSTELHVAGNTPFLTIRGTDTSYSNAGVQLISGNASNNRALGIYHYVENTDIEWFSGLPYGGNDAYVINRNTGFTVPSSQSTPVGIGASQGRLFTINASGNVGIGTTSPTARLDILTNSATGNSDIDKHIRFRADNGEQRFNFKVGQSGNAANLGIYDEYEVQKVKIDTNGDSYLNGGNVGIGTTSPSRLLDVDGIQGWSEGTNVEKAYLNPTGTGTDFNLLGDNGDIRFDSRAGSNSYINTGNVGIGVTNPVNGKLVVTSGVDGPLNTVKIQHTRDDADVGTRALEIAMDLSGADTTTADRTSRGIFVDLDSSADGDAANEHRIHGIESDVRFTGFTDLARGGYFYAESNNITQKTAQLIGVQGYAAHDSGSVNGGVSRMYGVYGQASIQDLGDVDNAFGGYFSVSIGTNRGNANIGVTKGVEGEILIDKANTINYGDMMTVSGIIDNNEGAVPNFGNQYLFKGEYQGTRGDNAWGIYTEGDKNYFEGNVGIGTTSPSEKLVVDGKVIINNTTPPNNLAQLNIGSTSGGETRAIDIDGNWTAGESKSITFAYGTDATHMVGQINCVFNTSTDSRLRWGKLYHGGVSSTYTMELKSTSTTTANLTVAGSIQMADDTDTASADKVGTMRYRTGTEYVEVDGEELVTNGDFATDSDWTKGANTTISGGTLNSTAIGVYVIANQSGVVSQSLYYKWTVTYTITSGGIRLGDSNNVWAGSDQTASGTYTGFVQAASTADGNLYMTSPSSDFIGSVDNVSVIEVTEEDASYADMCMQTGASTYEWVNIVRNTY